MVAILSTQDIIKKSSLALRDTKGSTGKVVSHFLSTNSTQLSPITTMHREQQFWQVGLKLAVLVNQS